MIINELRAANGRTEKEAILRSTATELDRRMFRYAYDKLLSFGLKFNDVEHQTLFPPTEEDFALLDRLSSRELSGAAARKAVVHHAQEFGGLVMLVCNKDLDCGASATTINNVFPSTVPQFKLQLAKEQPLSKIRFPCFVETKYDGVRLAIINRAGKVTFRTRNGKYVKLPILQEYLEGCDKRNYMLDTEVTLASGKMEDRTKVSGMITSAMRGGAIYENLLLFNVFDTLPLHDLDTSTCALDYTTRRVFVHGAVAELECPQLQVAQAFECANAAEVEAVYAKHIAQGFEGLILKHAHSSYTFKRTTDWTKMKETKTADLVCTGVVPGAGKYQGEIGALICEGTVEDVVVHVKAGSGLTDLQRRLPLHTYIGRVIELKYNTVITDKVTGRHSLFLPRFVTIRDDK